ncbi:MAG: DUF1080 domain-containing protein [Thermoguttaceae bacterium]
MRALSWVLLSTLTLLFTGMDCLAAADDQPASVLPNLNKLTDQEKADGWQLLFDGKTTHGWRNYRQKAISRGWKVVDGALSRVNGSAGDIVYQKPFENFVLELDYKVPAHANSGIMLRCSEDHGAAWATGIEFQLLDNTDPHGDSEKAGWAYALYKPADDPKTGKPLDVTTPIGHWNHVKIVYDGPHVEHWMNGVKYCEFEIGSADFKQRVQQSKFRSMPKFAKNKAGFIALQGDHGNVSFANVKIKVLPAK